MKKLTLPLLLVLAGCSINPDSDDLQRNQTESQQKQAVNSIGFPAITNHFEMRTLKRIYELRDQADLQTYTYAFNPYTGKYVFVGRSVGYGIPTATQFTNPQKYGGYTGVTLPQADPNGLYSPQSADATWVLLQNPAKPDEVKPCYFEQDIEVLPFPMDPSKVQ
jgi:hypothetical protein